MSTVPAKPAVSFFGKIWADVVKGEHAVIGALEKAASLVPEAESLIAEYGPVAGGVMNAIVPGSGIYATIASEAAAFLGSVIQNGGAAAEKNLLDLGADATLINSIKGAGATLSGIVNTAKGAPAPVK